MYGDSQFLPVYLGSQMHLKWNERTEKINIKKSVGKNKYLISIRFYDKCPIIFHGGVFNSFP